MNLMLPYAGFFSAPADEIRDVVKQTVTDRLTFRMCLKNEGVEVAASPLDEEDGPVELSGRWISTRMNAPQRPSIGSMLVTPLIFDIHTLNLPYTALSTFTASHGVAADYVLQNLLNAICRGDAVRIEESIRSEVPVGRSREFSKHYLWLLRARIEEPLLNERHALEKILLNAHVDTSALSSALLEEGVGALRREALDCSMSGQFRMVRDAMLSHYG